MQVRFMHSTSYMTDTQTDINAQMRSILIDWLVEVASGCEPLAFGQSA